ncbi:MAG: radical SAM protein [Alphaproteobacteria bacterium]
MEGARGRALASGQWNDRQALGRRWPIGCVALEITQRCNLDCAACYLSEHANGVADLPLEEVFRRIDRIRVHYGPNTDVQVTGGDPTLRVRHELVAIIRRIRERGMRPALFTNGLRVTRDLLEDLCAAGLVDVAFHVDLTQKRRGFATEAALDAVRLRHIDMARGLPLSVFFNTTVFDGNLAEIPELVRFFVRHSDVIRLASFQLQTDVGRSTLGERPAHLTVAAVEAAIMQGAAAPLSFDTARIGHARCNRYAMALVANGNVHDLLDDKALYARMLRQSASVQFDRQRPGRAVRSFVACVVRHPDLVVHGAGWLARKVLRMAPDVAAARGRVNKLSFFIHNFMAPCALEKDRIEACVFAVATRDGPVSMCLHNAKRDAFTLPSKPSSKPFRKRPRETTGLAAGNATAAGPRS